MKNEICICATLRSATRQITMLYDAALAPVDLRITQFTVLRILKKLGPLSVTRLAETGGLDRSTMGRNLDPLERRDFVSFIRGADQRERLARLTPTGDAAIARAQPLWEHAQRKARAVLPAPTVTLLEKIAGLGITA